jgi:hypothetical protein
VTGDIRVLNVSVTDAELSVDWMDGRRISVPLAWYPRLANATAAERAHWEIAGGGYCSAAPARPGTLRTGWHRPPGRSAAAGPSPAALRAATSPAGRERCCVRVGGRGTVTP